MTTLFLYSPPLAHEVFEALKEIPRVVRAGAGLGVILHGKDRQLYMPHALSRAVIEVDVCQFDLLADAIDIDTVVVVLRRYLNPTGLEVLA
ncbi:hypothetical protein MBAV_004043, partial [Candidatus Magnetobacterium bavaricum]